MCCFPLPFFHLQPKCAALRRNNFLPPNHLSRRMPDWVRGAREWERERERERETHTNGDGRRRRAKMERKSNWICFHIFRSRYHRNHISSSSELTQAVQGFASPPLPSIQGVLNYRKMFITVRREWRRKLERTSCNCYLLGAINATEERGCSGSSPSSAAHLFLIYSDLPPEGTGPQTQRKMQRCGISVPSFIRCTIQI